MGKVEKNVRVTVIPRTLLPIFNVTLGGSQKFERRDGRDYLVSRTTPFPVPQETSYHVTARLLEGMALRLTEMYPNHRIDVQSNTNEEDFDIRIRRADGQRFPYRFNKASRKVTL